MKKIGIVSYNIHCNFTNYGSALQSWALYQSIKELGYSPVLIDYCPDILSDKDPLNPFKSMWDQDAESQRMCDLSMPAIKENFYKFDSFYTNRFCRSKPYTSANFSDSLSEVDSYVCGSDTIFCPDEFGIDDGYYANYECMKNNSIAYAASFGDPSFTDELYSVLNQRLQNFKAIGLRENLMIPYVKKQTVVPVQKVLDPTLLLDPSLYRSICAPKQTDRKYLLLYSRRYNEKMEKYAEKLANQNGWDIIDISLRITNSEKGHIMRYDAGVEEFLSLVDHAEYVVTNSFHGMIFSVIFQKDFVIFSREQCNTKIEELLALFGLSDRMLVNGDEPFDLINYESVYQTIQNLRTRSLNFLDNSLKLL